MTVPSPLQLTQYRNALKYFVEFTDKEWSVFSEVLYLKKIEKKQHFISEGSICNEVGFISQGSFRFYFVKDGIEISNYFCFRNELI